MEIIIGIVLKVLLFAARCVKIFKKEVVDDDLEV